MGSRPWSSDTSTDAQRLLIDRWRAMAPWKKAEAANRLSQDCDRLARAGIRHEAPDLDERGIRFQLAIRKLGRELAQQVFSNGQPVEPH